jgi:hypothetical protein
MCDWTAVEREIDRIVSESNKPFAAETIANARDFATFAKSYCPVPRVGKGYSETIRLSWDDPPKSCEVEVFDNRIELYRFYQKRTDIKEIAHTAGEVFSASLLADLPSAQDGTMHRIYFDGNEGTEDSNYGLWLNRSRNDLAKIPGGPREGMKVTIYMIGEIEMEATLEWNAKWNGWTARPIEGTTRPNQEAWD